MLHTSPIDSQKLAYRVEKLLATAAPIQQYIFVKHNDFYAACKLSTLRKTKFREEVADVLCGSALISNHGQWLYTEYGDGYDVFVRIMVPRRWSPGPLTKKLDIALVLTEMPEFVSPVSLPVENAMSHDEEGDEGKDEEGDEGNEESKELDKMTAQLVHTVVGSSQIKPVKVMQQVINSLVRVLDRNI